MGSEYADKSAYTKMSATNERWLTTEQCPLSDFNKLWISNDYEAKKDIDSIEMQRLFFSN